MENEQLGFFDNEQNEIEIITSDVKLDIAKAEFIEGKSLTWKELFSGFDTLKAITYSSGIGFISQLISEFREAEIIFGCEQVMSYSLQEVMAFQAVLNEKIRSSSSKDNILKKIEDKTLNLLVARKKLSHEKIYLLSSENGDKRVIMGSANMSYQAFKGFQRENIVYMDGDDAYEWYLEVYNSLKENCTDEISHKSLLVSDDCENLDELPVSKTVSVNKVLEIIPDSGEKDNVEFALDVANLSTKIKPFVPKADKKGIVALSPTKIKSMKNHAIEERNTENEKRKDFPRLIVDVEKQTVELNGKELDLSPGKEAIQNDISLFLQYLNGYENFHGDYEYMQQRYYEFANWFFCSPFMASIRDVANRYNQNLLPYPLFGIIYGQSKAGKTSFLETLLKMMIGQKTRINAPDFTRKSIDALRYEVQGAPIIVDDLTQTRFSQHAVETIKNDGFGFNDNMRNYPAVVISANDDVKA
ncbi:MAG: phospholipase D family protein, partial [Oscillospiraceae bacterium]|nr:phospholipase D family protein [Oscillospiraceae bacterium]